MITYKHIEYLDWDESLKQSYKQMIKEFADEVHVFYDEQFNSDYLYNQVVNENVTDNCARNHTVTFLMNDNKPIGYVAWYIINDEWVSYTEMFITNCYVKKEYRKQGAYKKFIDDIPEICRSLYLKPPKYVNCMISMDNELSGNVHTKLGFKPKIIYCAKELKREKENGDTKTN